ncbi:hypothetical protein GALMADRAFT_226428 [Galerina marginata CBS 339.88]|uniref:HIG1 domain-containing protein n=1 Tax=Galerina marginata (strain CBS 339.88) TaxID=685588 RepID=A0A067SY10_GALM3|nr:hypothetical protein GALMADRAFT_226428 [Galerina marginata CBS 339.88]
MSGPIVTSLGLILLTGIQGEAVYKRFFESTSTKSAASRPSHEKWNHTAATASLHRSWCHLTFDQESSKISMGSMLQLQCL